MAFLRLVRHRSQELTETRAPRPRLLAGALLCIVTQLGCEPPDPELVPDEVLQSELGLEPGDRVHTVEIRTGTSEEAAPDSIEVRVGDLVQFVSADWMVHEVRFDTASLGSEALAFLERTRQGASPPLLERDTRFVLTFEDAPPGRYPYALQGNREPGRGVIVVTVDRRR